MWCDVMEKLGPFAAVMICAISLLAAGGWSYIFLTEQPSQMSQQGAQLAIKLGLALPLIGGPALIALLVAVVEYRWRPGTVWIVVCILAGVVGSTATLIGWTYYLGPSV